MHIIILSRSENVHADAVEEYCRERAAVSRINFDFDLSEPGRLPEVFFEKDAFQEQPDAVFVHHPRVSYRAEWFTDETEKRLFVASWNSLKEWMEEKFSDALWVNRPSANQRGKNLLGQLKIASSLGLMTPETLFTNSVDELNRFARNSIIVIKQGNLGVHLENMRILTSIVDVTAIDSGMLRGCPCLFQKYIEKQYELRIHVVGHIVLACKIDSQASESTRIDWRNYDLDNTPHEPYELGEALKKACVGVVQSLGLEFGIIDMVVTPQGEYVFLECNAQGHWGWIEKLTDLPITKTLCDHLLRGAT